MTKPDLQKGILLFSIILVLSLISYKNEDAYTFLKGQDSSEN